MKKYDMVMLEKPLDSGLTIEDVACLLNMVNGEEFIPVEIQGESSSAMGFLDAKKAEEIDYVYLEGSGIYSFVQDILEDMDNENPEGVYKYKTRDKKAVKIFLSREVKAA